ncbi:FkbM family methyltransferase [Caenimonas sp. SL110]|uniref:FkbM family methyltransferase n=1 Tax=Caenimonas sp. SL110 TaxID=1450524 RepID=UPI000ADD8075|nr:FkbM family methyltransferase [Caenimonas sp. SL110]
MLETITSRAVKLRRNIPLYLRTFGLRGLLAFASMRYFGSREPHRLFLRGNPRPIWVRPESTDFLTFRDIFVDREYAFELGDGLRLIVDAGANVGLAAIYFANAFPQARIIAIEPEHENFLLLQKNIVGYPQIVAVEAALWWRSGQIHLTDPGRGQHGFITRDDAQSGSGGADVGLVRAVCIEELLATHGVDQIDLLKVDIEGSEKEVFEASQGWIDRVSVVIVELHDRFKPGCAAAFAQATRAMVPVAERGKVVVKARAAYPGKA